MYRGHKACHCLRKYVLTTFGVGSLSINWVVHFTNETSLGRRYIGNSLTRSLLSNTLDAGECAFSEDLSLTAISSSPCTSCCETWQESVYKSSKMWESTYFDVFSSWSMMNLEFLIRSFYNPFGAAWDPVSSEPVNVRLLNWGDNLANRDDNSKNVNPLKGITSLD